MLNYFIILIAIIIFATVIIISAKAINRGIEAKRNNKSKLEDIIEVSDYNEVKNNSNNLHLNITNQINELNKLREKGIISEEEFKKGKDKILN